MRGLIHLSLISSPWPNRHRLCFQADTCAPGSCVDDKSGMTDNTATRDLRLAALMRAAQDGDASAYNQLLRETTPLLRRLIQRRLRFLQAADVEDLVQDVLLSLHSVRATYDPARAFMPWLMSIARNRMIDRARRHGRRAALEVMTDCLPETFSDDGTNMSGDTYGDPEALRHAIEALPRGQREAVKMVKLGEMSLKEASEKSGMSVNGLKISVHRAVKTLRRSMTTGT